MVVPNRHSAFVAGLLLATTFLSTLTRAAIANPRLAAVNNGALVPNKLAPRWFREGTSAHRLNQRQDIKQCPSGNHSCLDIGLDGGQYCCGNDKYCYVNKEWAISCCSLGYDCPDTPCVEDTRYCNSTSTSSIPVTTTIASTGGDGNGGTPSVEATFILTEIPVPACCPRACSSSSFSCQAAFGNQCCAYGEACASSNLCIASATSSPSISTLVSIIPVGCTTSQITCDASIGGGGCCDFGSTCTYQIMAATSTARLCAPNITVTDSDSSGLSSQAKAGVGAGVAIGAALVIGGLTWFCLRRRSDARYARASAAAAANANNNRRPGDDDDEMSQGMMSQGMMSPFPYAGRPGALGAATLSDVSGPTSGGAARPHQSGLVYDYFGPEPVMGPYTDTDADPMTTPGMPSGGTGRFDASGAPLGPDDIRLPVEIDSRVAEKDRGLGEAAPLGEGEGATPAASVYATPMIGVTPAQQEGEREGGFGPFELYGSPGSPSPLSPEEASQRRSIGPSSPTPGMGP
ncbi:Uu.00g100840.m01.CDS01 [Anthostomella pinea]|uniref:Uu.00g100840.m01.CDS01 n=1 Tax=Anthostomella pinea TaxID=933095 RepID=A0AAI8VCY1_9PEZI|nr:Uu.00g100840.m01.CDS01 [Anthostomella pinea]